MPRKGTALNFYRSSFCAGIADQQTFQLERFCESVALTAVKGQRAIALMERNARN